jgi:plastocyanin
MPTSLKLGPPLFVVAFAVSALGLYGGAKLVHVDEAASADDEQDVTNGGQPGGSVSVRIVAKDLKFDRRTINASPGAPVTVTFDNQDPGVPHNVAFYTNRSAAATDKIFAGQLITGPSTVEERFTAPDSPGNYYFRCDAHTDMNGTFSVR